MVTDWALLVKLSPEVVAVMALVVRVLDPVVAELGTLMVMLNVQLSPAAKVPPVKVMIPVPVRLEPVPQMLLWSPLDMAILAMMVSKSRVKPMPVASLLALAP